MQTLMYLARSALLPMVCSLWFLFDVHFALAQTCTGGRVLDTLDWDDPTLGWQPSMDGTQGPHTLYTDNGVQVTVTFANTCGGAPATGTYVGGTPALATTPTVPAGVVGDMLLRVDWPSTNCQIVTTWSFSVNGSAYTVQNATVAVKDIDQGLSGGSTIYDDRVQFPSVTSLTRGSDITAITTAPIGGHGDGSPDDCAETDTDCWITGTWASASSISVIYSPGPQSPGNPSTQRILFSDITMCVNPATVPVTVSSFHARPAGDGVQFDWTTATETANVGFYLYGEVNGSWQRLHSQLIPSPRIDSLVPQTYSHTLRGVTATQFSLAEVDIRGNEFLHGPYQLAQQYGQAVAPEPIDWRNVQRESLTSAFRAVQGPPIRAIQAASPPAYELGVDVTGLYRVTYEDLLAVGLDLNGIPAGSLALTNQGNPVALRVAAGQTPGGFGPGGFIEFFGEALDTLYTTTNIYRLTIDPTKALRVSEVAILPKGAAPTLYPNKSVIEENKEYSFSSPNGDPWYDSPILAFTSPAAKSFTIPVDRLVNAGGATLHVNLWGVTNWPGSIPDHHVLVSFNGVAVAERTFDGLVDASMQVPLAAGVAREGANTLTITVAGDTGFDFDLVHVESYGLTYPRAFASENNRLTFVGTAGKFEASQFTSSNVVVYGMNGGTPTRFTQVTTVPDGSGAFRVIFAGFSGRATTYLVSTVGALRKPSLAPARSHVNLLAGPSKYLVISHPSFLDGLSQLVAARQAQGFTVRVVNVEDIYAQYSGGVFDPTAIRRYLHAARQHLGVTHVLLVGGDTYDYHDYLGIGSISFVPSLYTQTDDIVRFAPSDALLADVDNDQVPDLAIGRFPVRTQQELATLVGKTLTYNAQGRRSVFAADAADGATSFSQLSDEMLATLSPIWSVQAQTAYIDQLGLGGARMMLISAMNQGVALTNYVGHSGLTVWSFSNLFSAQDAVSLTNSAPTLSLQWGCWNAYHSVPQYNTLSHNLLLAGPQGAAAVVGASTLTMVASDRAMSLRVLSNLTKPGQTLGQTILTAKRSLVAAEGNRKDVVLGLTLLGDPALVVEP